MLLKRLKIYITYIYIYHSNICKTLWSEFNYYLSKDILNGYRYLILFHFCSGSSYLKNSNKSPYLATILPTPVHSRHYTIYLYIYILHYIQRTSISFRSMIILPPCSFYSILTLLSNNSNSIATRRISPRWKSGGRGRREKNNS